MSDLIDDLNRFYESPENFDLSTHTSTARTVGIENVPIGQQQNLRHIPHVLYNIDIDLSLRAADFSIDFMRDVVQLPPIQERVNYIVIAPTVRNADFHVSFRGLIRPFLFGSVYYPMGDYVARAGQGSVVYRIPTMENMVISCICVPFMLSGAYSDAARILYGYLPDSDEKVVNR